MNTMMNIMPITVVLFGWTFASGAVVYWVAQSLYGIIQQWFITGWGKLNDYIPNLPELPEHKRLGYKAPRDLDAIDLANMPPKQRGMLGRWWEKQMQQAQQISEERKAAAAGGGEGAAPAKTRATGTAAPKRTGSTGKQPRPYARNSPKGRMLAEQARREEAEDALGADIVAEEVRDADIPANGANQGTPRRTRRGKK